MDKGELIELFYHRTYEKYVNKKILDDKNYIVPRQQLTNYVLELVNVPFIDYISYVKQYVYKRGGEVSDITQFGSFSTCEIEMCNALIWANNPGCQFVDIGRLFPNKITTRNDAAYRRFGESHIKAATQLGLTFEYYDYWYLSCLGYIYPILDEEVKKKLLARTITRNQLYQKMLVDILDHDVKPEAYINKQAGNIMKKITHCVCAFFEICLEECNRENIQTSNLIKYPERIRDYSGIKIPLGLSKNLYNYINGIKSRESSNANTIELIRKCRNGERQAYDQLFRGNIKLILHIAQVYRSKDVSFDDLVQEGAIGLLKAIEHYNENYNVEFEKYAQWWVIQTIKQSLTILPYIVKIPINVMRCHMKMWNYIQKYEQQNENPPAVNDIIIEETADQGLIHYIYNLPEDLKDLVSLSEDLDTYENNTFPLEQFEDAEYNYVLINSLLNRLHERDAFIVKTYFGIGTIPDTFYNIGKKLNLTRERTRQILYHAIKEMREIYYKKQGDEDNTEKNVQQRLVETFDKAYIGAYINVGATDQLGLVVDIQKSGGIAVKYTLKMKDGSINRYSPSGVLIKPVKEANKTTVEREKKLIITGNLKKNSDIVSWTGHIIKGIQDTSRDRVIENPDKRTLKKESIGANGSNYIPQNNDRDKEHLSSSGTKKSAFSFSTPLYELVQNGIITQKECHHCYKKRLQTIRDVYNMIQKYKLTPVSTRFTRYTLGIWFTIIDQLEDTTTNRVIPEKNKHFITYEKVYTQYTQKILTLRQAKINGKKILAKPVLLLALIEGVEEDHFIENKFVLDEWLEQRYLKLMVKYTIFSNFKNNDITGIDKPFWHLQTDGFWHLRCLNEPTVGVTPTKKWLKDKVEYAYFDGELWCLLKDKQWRDKLHFFIVNNKLNNTSK